MKVNNFAMSDLAFFNSRDNLENIEQVMESNFMDPSRDVISVWLGEEVIFLAGVNHLRSGVGEAWILGSDLIENNKLQFFKTIKGLIEFCFKELNLHRLQISVDATWDSGTKWATKLGFNYEGLAVASGSDRKDHHIFARVQ